MSEYWNDKWRSQEDYGRKHCPMCNATGKDLKEEEDRTKKLYRVSSGIFMYAKINVCKKCGYTW